MFLSRVPWCMTRLCLSTFRYWQKNLMNRVDRGHARAFLDAQKVSFIGGARIKRGARV